MLRIGPKSDGHAAAHVGLVAEAEIARPVGRADQPNATAQNRSEHPNPLDRFGGLP
jgi:hypothetical protein